MELTKFTYIDHNNKKHLIIITMIIHHLLQNKYYIKTSFSDGGTYVYGGKQIEILKLHKYSKIKFLI
jgi:hypothetical protein